MYDGRRNSRNVRRGVAPRRNDFPRRALIVPPRSGLPSAMAMQPPKPKLGVDPARSRDIMDDMVNAVRPDARSFAARRPRGVAIRFENERSPARQPATECPSAPPSLPSPDPRRWRPTSRTGSTRSRSV